MIILTAADDHIDCLIFTNLSDWYAFKSCFDCGCSFDFNHGEECGDLAIRQATVHT